MRFCTIGTWSRRMAASSILMRAATVAAAAVVAAATGKGGTGGEEERKGRAGRAHDAVVTPIKRSRRISRRDRK